MNSGIDPLMFGQMMQQIAHLSAQLERAETRMETLSTRLGEVEDRYKLGKAAVFGAVMVLGAAMYGIKDMFARVVDAVTP